LNSEEFCQFYLHYIPETQFTSEAIAAAPASSLLQRHTESFKATLEKFSKQNDKSSSLLFCVADKESFYSWSLPVPIQAIETSVPSYLQKIQKSPVIMLDTFVGMKLQLLPS